MGVGKTKRRKEKVGLERTKEKRKWVGKQERGKKILCGERRKEKRKEESLW